jgi:hypothetical protein
MSPANVIFALSSITLVSSTECFARSSTMVSTEGIKVFHLVNPDLREEHLKRIAEVGIDVQEAMDRGSIRGAALAGHLPSWRSI